MLDTTEDILVQLRAGEDGRAEFKGIPLGAHSVTSPNAEDMAGEMVAFANTEGGVILLGVENDGSVRGIPREHLGTTEAWVVNLGSNNCEPPIRPIIRKDVLPKADGEQAHVMLVEIKRGLYVHRTSGGRWYVRVGSSKRDLRHDELGRLLQQRGRAFVFDEEPFPDATAEDLDQSALERFFGPAPTIPWSDLLRNTRVTAADGEGVERPTVAGLLAFGNVPRHLRSAYIEAAVYRDTHLSSEELVHAEQIEGRVDDQIDQATTFIDRFMLRPATKTVGRVDYPQYDLGAAHEAIVNAVAHRDYSIAGSKVRLFLFSDRLELYSPGRLPNTLTIETMPYRVFTRNQLLVSFLSRMKSRRTGAAFLESRGEGVRRILEASTLHSGRPPMYEIFDDELRLTIWAKPSPHEERVRSIR